MKGCRARAIRNSRISRPNRSGRIVCRLADETPAARLWRETAAAAESRWSLARLAAFLRGRVYPVAAMFPAGAAAIAAGAGAGVLGIVLFVFAIRTHLVHKTRRDALDRELLVIDESARRAAGEVVAIRSRERPADADGDTNGDVSVLLAGDAWPLTEQERDDLDFYSPPVGMFGLLNRTSTEFGARRLRDLLEAPLIEVAAPRTAGGRARAGGKRGCG